MFKEQLERISNGKGFIAALDQSGGSTPKALKTYGVEEDSYQNDEEMYQQVHNMRTRIVTSPSFSGNRIIGAILFENTLHRYIENKHSAAYLWEEKNIVPFLKIDKGLADEVNGTQCLKPIPHLNDLLKTASQKNVFGTKMRSLIHQANIEGINASVAQQFEIAKQIIEHNLVPIIEPEVSIVCPNKKEAEALLKATILNELNQLNAEQLVMLKLTLPDENNFYQELIDHPNVVRVVALSGGYSREEANNKLTQNHNLIASFSRALSEELTYQQSNDDFNTTLDTTIQSIYDASIT